MKNNQPIQKSGVIGLLTLTVLLIVGFWVLKKSDLRFDITGTGFFPREWVPSTDSDRAIGHSNSDLSNQVDPSEQSKGTLPQGPAIDEEFRNWLSDQAQLLDEPQVDVKEAESQVRSMVERISPKEWEAVKSLAASNQVKASERVFATYLLVQGGEASLGRLAEFAQSELPLAHQDFAAHSEEETEAVRERALRVMAIDGMASQAEADLKSGVQRSDSLALLKLQEVAASAQSGFIREQAKARLDQLDP